MDNSIGSAPALAPTGSGEAASEAPQDPGTATANSWLLVALRQDLDANGDGKLSFQEFNQNRVAGNFSAEDQAKLAQIDQAAFDAIDQGDGGVDATIDFGVLTGNQYLINQIIQHGNPLPSDFLLASLIASGQMADPYALTPDEQKTLTNLQQKLCSSSFDSLSSDEKAVVQRAATNLLKADDALGGLAAGTAPTPEQLIAGITTLTSRIGYELGLKPVPSGVEAKNFDYQSLLSGGTGSDQLSLFAYNSVANQVKAESGSLGQTDQIGTIYVPYLKQEETQIGGLVSGTTGGAEKPLSAEQSAFVDEWTQTRGPLTADNMGQLTAALAEKFPPEAGWSFQTQQIADPWVGQRENLGTLQSQEEQAYREWNADGTPKVASPTHRAQALAQELQAKQQAFVDAANTLNDPKAWAIIDYLEGKDFDWQNDLVGDTGLQQLAGLTPESQQWEDLAADRGDRAVPHEERQKYIDAAKIATSPEQAGNLSALKALGDNADLYNRQDWQSWVDAQADVAPYAQSSQTPSAVQQGFSVAVSTLNKPSAWALIDLLEGSSFDMHNDLVGDNGLGKLAQLTPKSPEWDQLSEDKAVPDKAARQAMIDAAKLIGSPEQAANRDALRALGANPESYNKEDWQSWLDAQPAALYDLNHWLGRLSQGAGEILKPIHVDRDHLSSASNILLGIFTLGIGNAVHTGTHKPGYSAEQQFVVDQLRAQGRDTTALEKAMGEAQDEWKDALGDSIGWAVFGVLAAATFVGVAGGAVASAAATGSRLVGNVLGQAGRVVGGAIGGAVGVIDQAVVGGMGNLLTTLGAKVPAAVKGAWGNFVKRSGEGAAAQEQAALLGEVIRGLKELPAGSLTPEGEKLLTESEKIKQNLQRASAFENHEPQVAPQPPKGPTETATAPPPPKPAPQADAGSGSGEVLPNPQAKPSPASPTPEGALKLDQPPVVLNSEEIAQVKWHSGNKTAGEIILSNGSKSTTVAVLKTRKDGIIIGKFKGNTNFAATDRDGKFIGIYAQAEDDLWDRIRLQGGGRGDDGAGTSAAAGRRPGTNQEANTVTATDFKPWEGLPGAKLDELPPNVLAEIFNHLDPAVRKALLSTNKHLREVLRLEIHGLRVSGATLKDAITKFPNAKSIAIKGELTSDQLAALANAKRLEHLDLRKCRGLTPELLQQLSEIPKIQQLKKLTMRIPGSELEGTLQKLPNITELSLVGPITQEQVTLLVQAEKLEVLDLRKCTGLTNEMLESLSGVRPMSTLLVAPGSFAIGHGGLALEFLNQQAQILPAPFWASFPYAMVIGGVLGAVVVLTPVWIWLEAKNSIHPS